MIALGSEYKYGVGFPPIDGIHLEDCNFEVKTYVSHNKSVTFKKSDEVHIKKKDADNYIIIVDKENALKIGRGNVLSELTIYIPDGDFLDGFRTVIIKDMYTGWIIT